MKISKQLVIAIVLLMGFSACCPEEEEDAVVFRDLFENVADNIIIPRYAEFYSTLSSLEDQLNAIDFDDELTVIAAREQFKASYLAWQSVSVFEFGPAAEYSALLRSNCNTFPTNANRIEENILNGGYSLDLPANYEAKGMPALDYLLYHAHITTVTNEFSNELRLNYAKECVLDMKTRVAEVVNAWDTYRDVFVGTEGNDQNSSLSLLFNQFLYDYEKIKRDKFALPAGLATQFGIPIDMDTTVVEGRYAKMSLLLINANLNSLNHIFLGMGSDGIDRVGIYEKLQEYNATSTVVEGDLAEAIKDQFEICEDAVESLQNDFPSEIINNSLQVEEVYGDLQKMIPMIKNDMRSYLSVSVTITDADGD